MAIPSNSASVTGSPYLLSLLDAASVVGLEECKHRLRLGTLTQQSPALACRRSRPMSFS
jgi:hypothetical protein